MLAVLAATLCLPRQAAAAEPAYACSAPPLEVDFAVAGGRYSGAVHCGSLFLQPDIPTAPRVRWPNARPGRLYTLLMVDFDGNAHGSWPDQVAPGENAPVRHWIVGNLPGALLRGPGYREGAAGGGTATVLQPYRDPHIPMVSDRYGVTLFEQRHELHFAPVPDPVTNFDYAGFLAKYGLTSPVAANFFVVLYTSAPPFSGQPFHGNDVAGSWHSDLGKGTLAPGPDAGDRQP